MKNYFFILALFIIGNCLIQGPYAQESTGQDEENISDCLATQEYVTTLEYLRDKKEFALTEQQAQEVADSVSRGCTGASKRFVQVTNLLVKSQLDSRSAVKQGQTFAQASDGETMTFIHIFRQAFLREYLDLDMTTSLKMALELSLGFEGEAEKIRDDFHQLVNFCTGTEGLNLPYPQCANMAVNIVKTGHDFEESIVPAFLELYEFLTAKEGAGRTSIEALQAAEKVIKYGPSGVENYIVAFKYAVSDSGLDHDLLQAMSFAEKMASRSFKEPIKK